jgi:hypothetical protein
MVDQGPYAPSFLASVGAALLGLLGGGLLTAIVAWPFALASWTALAVGSAGPAEAIGGILLAAVLIFVFQVLVTAWITQHAVSFIGDASVRFRRALGGVFLGLLANVMTAAAFPEGASLPLVGRAWIGIIVIGFVLASAPPVGATSSA